MTVRKLNTGKWICECYPNGAKGRRIRKTFATKGEALAYENYINQQINDKPWLGEKEDRRRLSELIELWHSLHGRTLADPDRLLAKLAIICHGMGDPIAVDITQADFTRYRERRLSGSLVDDNGKPLLPIKPITANHEQRNLSAVFGTLKKLGHWAGDNPVSGIPKYKIQESELRFLSQEEIKIVLAACAGSRNKDVLIVAKICLATGARWNEAETLRGEQLSKYRIMFTKTKGKKNRAVPISEDLYHEIPKRSGRLFSDCRKAFERAINRTTIQLPEGQSTHVLRHTFASHFMMQGGNILVLKEILGHSDIKQTMIYAHFAPSYLNDAVTKNPLAMIADDN